MKQSFAIPQTGMNLYIVTVYILNCFFGQEEIYSTGLWGWIPFSSCDLQRGGKLNYAGLECNLVLFFLTYNRAVPTTCNREYFVYLGLRSNYKTPLQGLYLCGSGAHPGGGVMGAPGRNAARLVLQDVKELKG